MQTLWYIHTIEHPEAMRMNKLRRLGTKRINLSTIIGAKGARNEREHFV